METHIADITRAIQLAVAPVFLLTAIGTIIFIAVSFGGLRLYRR
jgi:hypothetical protein